MSTTYTIKLTPNQVAIVLRALENEANDDVVEFGEYSYARCYNDVAKKLIKEGFWCESFELNGMGGI